MSSSSVSDFGQNEWLVEEMYERFKADPNSVDPSWHEFLSKYTPGAAEGSSAASNGAAPAAA
ncbi:2-oxoglutarate dehydrogenase E1 subunit family protein, partial [Tsukamurella tyrosinosolvens]